MTPEQRSEISRRGGQLAQAQGTGHRFTPEEARAASKKRHQRKKSDDESTETPNESGG
jgi:hypothetical protein